MSWQVSLIDVLNFVLAVVAAIGAFVGFVVSRRDRKADQAENERRLQALEKIAANSHVPRHTAWEFEYENRKKWYLKNVGNGVAADVELTYTGGYCVKLPDTSGEWPPGRVEKGSALASGDSGWMKLVVSWTDESGKRHTKQLN